MAIKIETTIKATIKATTILYILTLHCHHKRHNKSTQTIKVTTTTTTKRKRRFRTSIISPTIAHGVHAAHTLARPSASHRSLEAHAVPAPPPQPPSHRGHRHRRRRKQACVHEQTKMHDKKQRDMLQNTIILVQTTLTKRGMRTAVYREK